MSEAAMVLPASGIFRGEVEVGFRVGIIDVVQMRLHHAGSRLH